MHSLSASRGHMSKRGNPSLAPVLPQQGVSIPVLTARDNLFSLVATA
jgi:hypothetical protein